MRSKHSSESLACPRARIRRRLLLTIVSVLFRKWAKVKRKLSRGAVGIRSPHARFVGICRGSGATVAALLVLSSARLCGQLHASRSTTSPVYHRLAARRGGNRAIMAVAHALLVMAYHMLQRNVDCSELGPDYSTALIRVTSRMS